MASFLPYSANLEDQLGHMSETTLTMPNENLMKTSVVEIPSGNKTANSFCIHLPCGLFNGTSAIPLDLVGGLLVEIHLAPDQNVLCDTNGSASKYASAFYELQDVFLAAEAQIVSSPPSVSTFEYNSLSTYFSSFNSINNIAFDGFSTMPPYNKDGSVANIKQIVFTRGGEKFPIEYNIDTLQQQDAKYRPYDPQLEREGASAVRKFGKMSRTMVSPNNSYLEALGTGILLRDNGPSSDYVDGGNCFILGVNYDSISNQGVSFATQNWGMVMDTGLISEFPQALFLFVHSKNTLVFDGKGGMQVIS